MKAGKERPVIVCTEHRGVFFGYAADNRSESADVGPGHEAVSIRGDHGKLN